MDYILRMLSKGDLRTTGASEEVINMALRNNSVVRLVVQGLKDDDPGIKMRSADVLEKIGSIEPRLLQPHKKTFLSVASKSEQQEVQWHMAQIISYLNLTPKELEFAKDTLLRYYNDSISNIVKAFSLTALAQLSSKNEGLKPVVKILLDKAVKSGTPSIKTRAKKILSLQKKQDRI
ncbi:hypothetical protein HY045_03525 [Candidatus Woesebacteria bacterium]|nr:hypothetical protein [Candidatus Woesebacteria bacterium]